MYNRFYKFLVEYNILYQKQFWFRNAHSTEYAILQLVNQITEVFIHGKYTRGIFTDLSKAFDTVNDNILLEKLKAYGIQSETLKWFRKIENRKQFISLFRMTISKQKRKLFNKVFLKVFARAFAFSYFCKPP